MGNVLASMAAYVASQERQDLSRRTIAGLDAAWAKGKELGRPQHIANEQLTTIRQNFVGKMPVAALTRKSGDSSPVVSWLYFNKTGFFCCDCGVCCLS